MVKINDIYYIDADSKCYALKEKKINPENGKVTYREIGYYTDIEGCYKGLMKKEIRKYIGKDEEISIKQLITKINKLESTVKDQFKGL